MPKANKNVAAAFLRAQAFAEAGAIERQLDACTASAASQGLSLDTVYVERGPALGIAGRSRRQALMADAAAGKFNVLIIEDLDRLSRDCGELPDLLTQLSLYGVEVRQVGFGRIRGEHVQMRGLMTDAVGARSRRPVLRSSTCASSKPLPDHGRGTSSRDGGPGHPRSCPDAPMAGPHREASARRNQILPTTPPRRKRAANRDEVR